MAAKKKAAKKKAAEKRATPYNGEITINIPLQDMCHLKDVAEQSGVSVERLVEQAIAWLAENNIRPIPMHWE